MNFYVAISFLLALAMTDASFHGVDFGLYGRICIAVASDLNSNV